jgi:hypothetical protein
LFKEEGLAESNKHLKLIFFTPWEKGGSLFVLLQGKGTTLFVDIEGKEQDCL